MEVFMKYYITKILTDEDFRNKNLVIIIALICIFISLISIIVSLPSIVVEGIFGESETDMEYIQMYQDSIIILDEKNQKWIKKMEEEYSWCDSVAVYDYYTLTWYELTSIDSVRYRQDFNKVTMEKILDLAEKFIVREVIIDKVDTGEEILTIARVYVRTKTMQEIYPDVNIKDEEDILLAENIYATLLDMNVEGDLNIYDEDINLGNLEEYPEGYANLPYFNQTDARWGYNNYGSSTIAEGGCGPTALAMVVSGLSGNRIEPDEMANWSYRNGHRAEGSGSYWSLMTEGGSNFGLNVEPVSRKNPNAIKKALSEGKPIIVSMGKGHFTNGGHFIVLRGITEGGKILVHDPSSVNRSNQEWDLSVIMNESSTNGGVNGSPFWVFSN